MLRVIGPAGADPRRVDCRAEREVMSRATAIKVGPARPDPGYDAAGGKADLETQTRIRRWRLDRRPPLGHPRRRHLYVPDHLAEVVGKQADAIVAAQAAARAAGAH